MTLEVDKGDPSAAIERYRKVAVEPWHGQAAQRIAVMEAKALSVVTERAFRSGETPRLKIATRNLDKLTFTAYKIDPETYFRKKHALRGVEDLDIGLVAPDAEWTAEVPGYGKYRPIETTYELKTLELPGVYVVKVSDDKTLQATTLVLGSDLDAIVKTSREQVLVFAQDMKTGKGRARARVLVSDDEGVILDARTGEDGVLVRNWESPPGPGQAANEVPAAPRAEPAPAPPAPPALPDGEAPASVRPRLPQGAISYLVLDGDDVAGSGLSVPEKVAQGLSARAYLYTDRPAYRPGHEVQLRGVVREVVDGQYANVPGASYSLEVFDSRGRKLINRSLTLSDFGTFHETIPLDPGAPVGSYRVRLSQPGKGEFAGAFEVQAYQLEKIDLAFDLPRTVYYRGETVKGSVVARYQYGTPLANRAIALQLPDGRTLQGQTDATGKYAFELETTGFSEEQALRLVARLPQDNVGVAAAVMLAVRAFRIDLNTTRDVYLDGESFSLNATTLDAQGEPTGQTLSVALLKRVERNGQVSEREAGREELVTDKKTGKGATRLKVEDEEGGSYVVRASGTDRFGNPVIAERLLTISGKKDETKLRILTDRTTFKVGESAEVRLVNRGPAGTALLTWEADRILSYRVVPLKEGENALTWEVDGPQFPNFTLAASRMAPPALHEARLDVRVERDLRLTVTPKAPSVGPGGEVEVEVAATDQNGKPVAAEVSIALVDRSLLRLFADRLPTIDQFFYNQSRTSAFATESSATFRYQPATVPVPEAVVEDAAQQAALLADAEKIKEAKDAAGSTVALGINGPRPMAAPAAPPGMAGVGGMMRSPQAGAGRGRARPRRRPSRARDGVKRELAEMPPGADATVELFDAPADAKAMDTNRDAEPFGRLSRRGGRMAAAAGEAEAAPRERFVETAYWNPSVVTGKDGKATVKFRAPAALSEYRFTARGVTGRDTLVGQATADLAVRKDFFVDLKVPSAVTQGDKPRFSAEVHHKGVVGPLALRLTIYAGGREVVMPRRVEVKADGVEEVLFDPFPVPDGDEVRLTLDATLGEVKDSLTLAVPIRPWGVEALASASGSATDDTTAFVALPPGREYEQPEMLVVISPTVRRMLIELALGEDAYPLGARERFCIPQPPNTTADRAGDLLAAGAAMAYLQSTRATGTPEAVRLTGRIRGLVSELVSLQNEDGGWPWVAGTKGQPRPSDRMTSARVAWSLTTAESLGLMTDPAVLDKAGTWLAQEFAKLEGGDNETRATLLHALSTRNKASFEQANALNRVRQGLSNVSLAYLALTFANLDRVSLGDEVVGVLAPRGKTEPTEPGGKARRYWSGEGQHPWHRSDAETTALAALAFARVRPQSPDLAAACDWLLAHRRGIGWQPPKAKGPALAALAKFHGSAQAAEDRYRLVVTVNDQEVYRADVVGATEGKAVLVPRRFLKAADRNRVKFDVEGRGTVRLRRHADGLHPRLRPRPGPREQALRDPPPRLLGGRAGARRQAPGTGLLDRPPAADLREYRHPGGARGQGPDLRRGLARPARGPAVLGARLPRPEGIPPGRHHPRRRLRQLPGRPLHGGGRRPHPLFHPRPAPQRRVRGLRLPARRLPRPAAEPLQRLRARPPPPGRPGRPDRPGARREVDRPVQAHPRRAIRPRQGPLRRGPPRRGRPAPEEPLGRLRAARRRRQGRRPDAADHRDQGLQPEGRGRLLRGPEGEGPRARDLVRRHQGRRPRLRRPRRARARLPRLAGDDRGQLPRGRPRRRGPAAARQGPGRHRVPARPLARLPLHGVDPERLLRARPGRRRPRRACHDRPGDPHRARRRRRHPVRPAPAGDPPRPGLPLAVAQGPAGRRGEPRPGRRLPRPGGLRLRREALPALRRALPQEHVPGQLPVLRGPGEVPPRRVRPGDRRGRTDRGGDVQGRERRGPAEPEQVAGRVHPRPDPRRPPRAGPGARVLSSAWPSGSPTPPARSRRSPARS